jgi:hypothetical protein
MKFLAFLTRDTHSNTYREDMPSVRHEAPLELIRQCPPIAVELVKAMTGSGQDASLPEKVSVSLGPTDLSEVVPVTFLADSVVVVSDAVTGEPLLAIIIEPQGRDSPTKKFSWPVYVAAARRALQCRHAFLLVICPDPAEAEKCRQVIRTGHPGFDLAPVVIDQHNIPGTGTATPYLTLFAACMGAIDMTGEDGARHVLTAIDNTGAAVADRNRLTAIILNLASDAARQTMEALMSTIDWTTHPFIERFKKEGHEEGIKEGLKEGIMEGLKEGLKEGVAAAKAEDVLKLVDANGIKLTNEQREQVTPAAGLTQLGQWFDRALTAKTAADIFQE